ncbi:MAG: type I restriction endonuclease [Anaerovoracaceae bacterium]
MKFNEDSRVKLPALIHFNRLGYTYQSKNFANIDKANNIFVDIFKENISRINKARYNDEIFENLIADIAKLTDNDKDEGAAFYEYLTKQTGIKLIDLENPLNNDFRVVSELPFASERDNFRPDITILINGIPLGFIEVKKPNNQRGMQAEFERMEYRCKVPDFTHFMNQFQVLGFSNNMEYDDESRNNLQGSFYSTPNGKADMKYNHFREEKEVSVNEYVGEQIIDEILVDNNLMEIKYDVEFINNLKPDTSVLKFCTSLFSKERLIFFIKYGIVFVDSRVDGYNKHIMRYPQFFALQNLVEKIDKEGMTRGILWHTQGSGKTAWSYFATNVLRDYYSKKNIVTKFYFVVDRLDLLKQAKDEFSWRGMTIASITNKLEFTNNIKSTVVLGAAMQGGAYKETMNLVNIQKFSEDSKVVQSVDKNVQRIYFLDEVHRSYKPKGSFLANLLGVDKNGIFIGLTGTPLLKEDRASSDIFGDYIHKYYYNKSIADGYTLKIRKEDIDIKFRNNIREMVGLPAEEAEGSMSIPPKMWKEIIKAPEFTKQLCEYIQKDYGLFLEIENDRNLGFMIVTAGSEQARDISKWFSENTPLKTALVLHDEEENSKKQEEFRGIKDPITKKVTATYDGVIVFNMLLTGFDAPRLKKLYLLRPITDHSLLQTLARVNRPYKRMKYGHIVDFVDITEEYEKTNERYLEELNKDLLDDADVEDVKAIFVDTKAVEQTLKNVNAALFNYLGNIENNLEAFTSQISSMEEKPLRELRANLETYKECYNELLMSHKDVSDIPIEKVRKASSEVTNRINLVIADRVIDGQLRMEDIDFSTLVLDFIKKAEIDLSFTSPDDIQDRIGLINNAFYSNSDKEDEEYIKIENEFRTDIKEFKTNINAADKKLGQKSVELFINSLDDILRRITEINNNNTNLVNIYLGDDARMRIHKRLKELYGEHLNDSSILEIVSLIMLKMNNTVGTLEKPTQAVISQNMKRPVKEVFEDQGYKLALPQINDIIHIFVQGKFSE